MRKFPYTTLGVILKMLRDERINISRPTLYNLEKKGVFLKGKPSPGGWRIYSLSEATAIVQAIKEAYRLDDGEEVADIIKSMANSAQKIKEIQPGVVVKINDNPQTTES